MTVRVLQRCELSFVREKGVPVDLQKKDSAEQKEERI
jgi:hypothetical protein